MHTPAEAQLLIDLVNGARCVVEIGVYEGSSALVFCDALTGEAQLPFADESGWSLRRGWRATPTATRLAVRHHARDGGPMVAAQPR